MSGLASRVVVMALAVGRGYGKPDADRRACIAAGPLCTQRSGCPVTLWVTVGCWRRELQRQLSGMMSQDYPGFCTCRLWEGQGLSAQLDASMRPSHPLSTNI